MYQTTIPHGTFFFATLEYSFSFIYTSEDHMLPFERPWTFAGKMSRNRKKKKPKTEAAKTEATKAEGSQRPRIRPPKRG